ncbi:methyltransferase domain-containing protein [Azospirillum sp.]|uniref:class I SAM-dependent DNA methyltransferase n=1 Tax=Azospirillum sp. TaxID=34012 RepID=UPI003D70B673
MMVSDQGAAAGRLAAANAALAAGDLDGAVNEALGLIGSGGAEERRQARTVLDSVIDKSDLHRAALLARSRLSAESGDRVGAIKDAASAVTAAPKDAEANTLLSEQMAAVGRLDEAAMFSYEALKAAPGEVGRYAHLAAVLRRQKSFEATEELLRTAVSLAPHEAALVAMRMDSLVQLRRLPEAIALGQEARKRFPEDARLLRMLAAVLQLDGRDAETVAVLRDLQRIAPNDGYARHVLASATGGTPAKADPDFVRVVFDMLAPRYDDLMLGARSYRAPALIAQAVRAHTAGKDLSVLDLGCGTGLCGLMVRDMAATLKGIDLTPAMAEYARTTHIYDSVEVADAEAALAADTALYDAVMAGDTLAYIGDVAPLLALLKAHLKPGGVFVFSVEVTADGAPLRLTPAGSFAHGRGELERLATAAGFTVAQMAAEKLRLVNGEPLRGVVGVLKSA